jgi:hypothetical protein
MKHIAAALIISVALAAPASADPSMDANFLRSLDIGHVPYTNGPNAIVIARAVVCDDFRQGYDYSYVTDAVGEMNLGWTDYQTGFFVGAASSAGYDATVRPVAP